MEWNVNVVVGLLCCIYGDCCGTLRVHLSSTAYSHVPTTSNSLQQAGLSLKLSSLKCMQRTIVDFSVVRWMETVLPSLWMDI